MGILSVFRGIYTEGFDIADSATQSWIILAAFSSISAIAGYLFHKAFRFAAPLISILSFILILYCLSYIFMAGVTYGKSWLVLVFCLFLFGIFSLATSLTRIQNAA